MYIEWPESYMVIFEEYYINSVRNKNRYYTKHYGSNYNFFVGRNMLDANCTLFILHQTLTSSYFYSFQGFSRLRMYNKGGSPVAFVEYQVIISETKMSRVRHFLYSLSLFLCG